MSEQTSGWDRSTKDSRADERCREEDSRHQRRRHGRFNLIMLLGVVGAIVAGLLVIALFLPARCAAPEAVRRMACPNNLKQIALAIHNYAYIYKSLPPACIRDKDGRPMHSWRVLILPFLEQDILYCQYRLDEPWDGPHNRLLTDKMPSVYYCPKRASKGYETSYLMLVGPRAIGNGPHGRTWGEIKDGASNTILLAEAVGAQVNWMEPRDLDAEHMSFRINETDGKGQLTKDCLSSNHLGGAHVAFCEASVRFLSNDLDEKTLKALTTIDGGEKVGTDDL